MRSKFRLIGLMILLMLFLFGLSQCTKQDNRDAAAYGKAMVKSPAQAKMLKLQENLKTIRSAIQIFVAQHQRFPSDLDELTAEGVISHLPQDPFGEGYDYDADTGKVTSISNPKL